MVDAIKNWLKSIFTRGDGTADPAAPTQPVPVPVFKDGLGTLTLSGLLTLLVGTALNAWAPALAGTLTPVIVQAAGALLGLVGVWRRKDITSVLGIIPIGETGKKDIKSLSFWGIATTVLMPVLAKHLPEGVAYSDLMGELGLVVGALMTILGVARRKDVVTVGGLSVSEIKTAPTT